MNKGILAGGVENGTFIAIPSFKCGNSGSTFELNNGSMIKAEIMDIPNVTFKAAGTRSLINPQKAYLLVGQLSSMVIWILNARKGNSPKGYLPITLITLWKIQ